MSVLHFIGSTAFSLIQIKSVILTVFTHTAPVTVLSPCDHMWSLDGAVVNPHRTAFSSIVMVWDFLEEDAVIVLVELLTTHTKWSLLVAFATHQTMMPEVYSTQPLTIDSCAGMMVSITLLLKVASLRSCAPVIEAPGANPPPLAS
jgi:hypothetical protein